MLLVSKIYYLADRHHTLKIVISNNQVSGGINLILYSFYRQF